ncbi:MAG: hypothetical protein CMG17_07315 [Candidatus Marinimicrobia bacterium]|nr:hypothetical protein [Candidatus Neomarinimicrobiota bacterium]
MKLTNIDDCVSYMISIGADKIPHRDEDLLTHSYRVSSMLYSYGRSMDEVKAGLFHSIYGTEFQRYKINVSRKEIKRVIGKKSEHIVNLFCTLNDRVNTILYGRGLKDPDKTILRWLEYCNIKDQDPKAQILKEFEIVLSLPCQVDEKHV